MKLKNVLGLFAILSALCNPAFATNTRYLMGELWLDQISTPATPPSGRGKVYAKSGNVFTYLDSTGTEHTILFSTGNAATATALASTPTGCSTHQFADAISANGNLTCVQPAFTDISGVASPAQIPTPGASTLGGVQSLTCGANQFVSQLDTSGVLSCTAPTASTPSFNAAIKTSNYVLVAGDAIAADATSGSFTLTLPDATSNAGKTIAVIRKDAVSRYTVTIARAGTDTFNGGDKTLVLTDQNTSVYLFAIGTSWYVF